MLNQPGERGEENDKIQVFYISTKESRNTSKMLLLPDAVLEEFCLPSAGLALLELYEPGSESVGYDVAPVIVSEAEEGSLVIISTRINIITTMFSGYLAQPTDPESNAINESYLGGRAEYFIPDDPIFNVVSASRKSLIKVAAHFNQLAEYLDRMPIFTFRSDDLHFQTVYTGNEQDGFGFEFINLKKELYIPHHQKVGVRYAKGEEGKTTMFVVSSSDNWLKDDLESPNTELFNDHDANEFCIDHGFPLGSSVFRVTGVDLQHGFYVRSAYKKDVQEDTDKGLSRLVQDDVE